jgi:branched-chain amino acid transport system permease protein
MVEFLQQLINGLAWGSIYALLALGYTMVYGVLKFVNFAHGDVYMVGAFIAYYLAAAFATSLAPGPVMFATVLVASMAGAALLGFIIERLAYRPLRSAPRLTVLITAIGVSLFLENGGQRVFGADPKVFPTLIAFGDAWRLGELRIAPSHVLILAVSLVLMVGLEYFVQKTKQGKALRAVSQNADAAALMGVPVDRIVSLTFVLGAALAAAAGVLVSMDRKIEPLMGIMPGLKAFVAAVLGGIGSIPGAVVGGLIMGVSEILVVGYVSSTYRDAIAFVLLILILMFRPAGLLGKGMVEKV